MSLILPFAPKKSHLTRSMFTENRSASAKQNHSPELHCNMFCNISKKSKIRRVVVKQKSIMTSSDSTGGQRGPYPPDFCLAPGWPPQF